LARSPPPPLLLPLPLVPLAPPPPPPLGQGDEAMIWQKIGPSALGGRPREPAH